MKGQPQGSGQVAPGQAAEPPWACPGERALGAPWMQSFPEQGLALKLGAHEAAFLEAARPEDQTL